ncbi:MAG: hypothetical protein ACTSVY_14940 [Candidatus Helarchaeota archaeon]
MSDTVRSRTDVFKNAGSSRVVASGSWTIVMAIFGAVLLFIFQIIAGNYYGEGGDLSYFSVTSAFLAIFASISAGFGNAFLKFSKEVYTRNKEEGKNVSIQMPKIKLIIGSASSVIMLILTFIFISNLVLFLIFLGYELVTSITNTEYNLFIFNDKDDLGSIFNYAYIAELVLATEGNKTALWGVNWTFAYESLNNDAATAAYNATYQGNNMVINCTKNNVLDLVNGLYYNITKTII